MNYLPNNRNKKTFSPAIAAALLIVAIFLALGGARVTNPVMGVAVRVFEPFWKFAGSEDGTFASLIPWISAKKSLSADNLFLREENARMKNELLVKDSLLRENLELKRLLGRVKNDVSNFVIAAVAVDPEHLAYDIAIADAGEDYGVRAGDEVFIDGTLALGKVAEVFPNSSKIKLYSYAGEQMGVILGPENLDVSLEGTGDGNFTLELPKSINISIDDDALLPSSDTKIVARVGSIESDEGSSIQKLYLRIPTNLRNLRWVIIEHSR